MEGFVEGVEEVADDDEDEDATAMKFEAWGLGHWFGITGANCDAIVDALKEGCGVLCCVVLC